MFFLLHARLFSLNEGDKILRRNRQFPGTKTLLDTNIAAVHLKQLYSFKQCKDKNSYKQ